MGKTMEDLIGKELAKQGKFGDFSLIIQALKTAIKNKELDEEMRELNYYWKENNNEKK